MSGPNTSPEDLVNFGMTLEIAERIYNPGGPGTKPYEPYNATRFLTSAELSTQGAPSYNVCVQNWKRVASAPGSLGEPITYTQQFPNFVGSKEVEDLFRPSFSKAVTSEYTLSTSFTVGAEAGISVEGIADIKVSVSATSDEVQKDSTSVVASFGSDLKVDVPAGEGRQMIADLIPVKTINTYKAVIGFTGPIGILYEINASEAGGEILTGHGDKVHPCPDNDGKFFYAIFDNPIFSQYTNTAIITEVATNYTMNVTEQVIDKDGKVIKTLSLKPDVGNFLQVGSESGTRSFALDTKSRIV